MQITANIPDDVAAQVHARGLALERYVEELVVSHATTSQPRLVRIGPGPYSPEEAGRQIRELRKGNRLDGLKVKNLIDEGRRI